MEVSNDKMIAYSISEAAERIGVSKNLLYQELKRNPDVPRIVIGTRILIPARKLEEYLNT